MKLIETIKKLIDQELDNLHVALPARVEKYDPKSLRAEVTLLNKQKVQSEEMKFPPIIECPVRTLKAGPFTIRPPYQKGDVVQVLFNERALDQLLITGKPESVLFKRRHSLDDAVVIGGLKIESESDLPEDYTEDLLVLNQEVGDYLIMKKGGGLDIGLSAGSLVQIGTLAEIEGGNIEGVSLGESLKEWIDKHKHVFIDISGIPKLTTEPQTAPGATDFSPDPSKKVLVS